MKHLSLLLGLGLWLAITAISPAVASGKAALVIGNSDYLTAPLANPANDAKAIAQRLGHLGFTVKSLINLDQPSMYEAVEIFFRENAGTSTLLFFYAGHAVQLNGKNYLIPVDAPLSADDLLSRLFDLRFLVGKLSEAGGKTKLVILDACRNNPFSSRPQASSGLAEMNAPLGTFIAFSTAPGATAEDGDGIHSPYATHLLANLSRPGAKIEDVFKEVRVRVNEATQGAQIPWESTSLESDFYFVPPLPLTESKLTKTSGTSAPSQNTAGAGKNRCSSLMLKLSLGVEPLNHEEKTFFRSCR